MEVWRFYVAEVKGPTYLFKCVYVAKVVRTLLQG